MSIKHTYTATGTNDGTKQVSVTRWNDAHSIDVDGIPIPCHSSLPASPAAGSLIAFARSLAGREMLTYLDSDGFDAPTQTLFGRTRPTFWFPVNAATTLTFNGAATLTATGTATAATVAAGNLYNSAVHTEFLVTPASTSATAGYRTTTAHYWRGNGAGLGGFFHIARVGFATGTTVATRRAFIGMAAATTVPTDVQPSSQLNIVGAGYDAADANWQLMFNDGTGTATKYDTGIARPSADRTTVVEVIIHAPVNGGNVTVQVVDLVTGATFSQTEATDLPSTTTLLAPRAYASVGGTSSVVGLGLFSLYIESDV